MLACVPDLCQTSPIWAGWKETRDRALEKGRGDVEEEREGGEGGGRGGGKKSPRLGVMAE